MKKKTGLIDVNKEDLTNSHENKPLVGKTIMELLSSLHEDDDLNKVHSLLESGVNTHIELALGIISGQLSSEDIDSITGLGYIFSLTTWISILESGYLRHYKNIKEIDITEEVDAVKFIELAQLANNNNLTINFPHLEKLVFDEGSIADLPTDGRNCPKLEKLEISDYVKPDIMVPACISRFKNLKDLKIECDDADIFLPETIGELILLEKLHIVAVLNTFERGNMELPESFGNLSSLKDLSIVQVNITKRPVFLGNLSSLESLKIDMHYLTTTTLPENFGELGSLRQFYLIAADIEELPESFGELKSLETLNLDSSSLVKLPESFGNLSSLKFFSMNYSNFSGSFLSSRIKTLPDSFGNLASLREIDFSSSTIEELPAAIGCLESLKKLDLAYSCVSQSVFDFIVQQKSLEILDLNRTNINHIPDDLLEKLPLLKELNIEENRSLNKVDIPPSILDFQGLKI